MFWSYLILLLNPSLLILGIFLMAYLATHGHLLPSRNRGYNSGENEGGWPIWDAPRDLPSRPTDRTERPKDHVPFH